VEGKINVHLVPHSHDDTGWLKTVDGYFFEQVYYIVDTIVDQLLRDENRKFMFVEIAFFARWWEEQPDDRRDLTRQLVKEGRLEFINGGWCMHDEAAPHYVEMVDQTTRGHQFLRKNFGEDAVPKATWQIDPFGHSATQAWLLSAEAGMQSLFWGRMDYQDFNARKPEKKLEWLWQGSESMGASSLTLSGNLYGTGGGGYSTWLNFDGNGEQVNDNPHRHDYNVDQYVDKFVQDALKQAADTKTDHQLWAAGTDFQYQNADHWYHNLDKLIHYVNQNGTVNAFYSTPTIYTQAKFDADVAWEVRKDDDIFPLADNAHHYWTGYFTSRPSFKKQVRISSNLLNAARQMEVLSGISAADVNLPTTRPSPTVGDSFTDSLEGATGVATHHDGMSGTSKQDVSDDYQQRMSESSFEVEAGVALALQRLMGTEVDLGHCNCNTAGNCLNISVCAFTTEKDDFTVVAWNPLGQATRSLMRLPVVGDAWTVTADDGSEVPSQAVALDDITKQLPLLYVNKHGMTPQQVKEAEDALQNSATHVLMFSAEIPAVGFNTFAVVKSSGRALAPPKIQTAAKTVSNGVYELSFDESTNELVSVKNLASKSDPMPLKMTWGWYNSSTGGCTGDTPVPTEPALDCVSWRNTGGSSAHGPREPQNDLDCSKTVDDYRSGWCECAGGVKRAETDGQHQTFTCNDICAGVYPVCWNAYESQKSGAYIFRPNSSDFWFPGPTQNPTIEIIEGDVVTEVRQIYSDWVSHVIRLVQGEPYIEVEWTVGPIPVSTPWMEPQPGGTDYGKEVSIRYDSGIQSNGVFYTDSNGREMMKRVYNSRPDTYPELDINEPVAGNYYPVNAMMSLDDGRTELTVLTDVTQGGASLANGSLELMVHRRTQADDSRGVGEPLNETMCGCIGDECDCAGLTMRGRHWLVLDSIDNSRDARRVLSDRLNFAPTLAFAPSASSALGRKTFSALAADLPQNVKFQTLTNNYASFNDGRMLFRLSHLYSAGEHPTLSQPVEVDLSSIFGGDVKIVKAQEMSLSGNQDKATMESNKYQWKTEGDVTENPWTPMSDDLKTTLRPMEVKTFFVELQGLPALPSVMV
jgi:alpha-mannosidase